MFKLYLVRYNRFKCRENAAAVNVMIDVFVKSLPFLFNHVTRIQTFMWALVPCHDQYTPRSLHIDY